MASWSLGKGPDTSPRQNHDRQLALDWLNTAGNESEIRAGNGDEPEPTMSPVKRKRGSPRKNAQNSTEISNEGQANTVEDLTSPVQPKKKRSRPRKYPKISPGDTDHDSRADGEELATQTTPLTRSRKRGRDSRSLSAKKAPKRRWRLSGSGSSSDESYRGSGSDVSADIEADADPDGEWTGRNIGTRSSRGRRLSRGSRRRFGHESRLRGRTQPQLELSTTAPDQDDVFALGATPPPLGTENQRSISLRKKEFFQSSDSEEAEIAKTGVQYEVMVVVNQPNEEGDVREDKSGVEQDKELEEEPEISQPKTDSQDQSFQPSGETEERRMDEQLDQELESNWDPRDSLSPLENSGRSEQRTQDEGEEHEEEGEESQHEAHPRVKAISKVIEYRGYRSTGVVEQEGYDGRKGPSTAMDHGPEANHEDIGESSKSDEYMDIDEILNGQISDKRGQADGNVENRSAASDTNEHADEMDIDGPAAETEALATSEQAQLADNDATENRYHSEIDDDSSSSSSEESEEEEIDGLMNHPAFKEASLVFDQEETWLEMVDESQRLLRKARRHLKPLSASLHELLASVQRARNAFNETINDGSFVEPDKDLIPDLDRKVSTVLSEIEVLTEEEVIVMSPDDRLRRQKSLCRQLRGIQTFVVPRMVEMIVPAAIIYHHLESTQAGRGLGEMRELFRLIYALCNESKPSRYTDEQDVKFKDRLKAMRPSARLLFYVYENEMTKRLPQALSQRQQNDERRQSVGITEENAIRIASQSPPQSARSSSLMLSSPHATLPSPKHTAATKKTETKRTTESRRKLPPSLRQQSQSRPGSGSRIRSERPMSSTQLAKPSSEASPSAVEIPLTNENIKRMIDGLQSFTGPKRYEQIKQKYSGHFGKFPVNQIHALAMRLKPAFLSDLQDRGVEPNSREHGWFLNIK